MLCPRNYRQLLATQRTREWLTNFADKHGEKMPDSSKIHLSSLLTKHAVYLKCKAQLESMNEEPLSETYFYKVWNQKFSNLIIPKVGLTPNFMKCT